MGPSKSSFLDLGAFSDSTSMIRDLWEKGCIRIKMRMSSKQSKQYLSQTTGLGDDVLAYYIPLKEVTKKLQPYPPWKKT